MAIPNLIALVLLGPMIFIKTKQYKDTLKAWYSMRINEHIKIALKEDCYEQDVTTKLVPLKKKCKTSVNIKNPITQYSTLYKRILYIRRV